jgi:hypothetical protein
MDRLFRDSALAVRQSELLTAAADFSYNVGEITGRVKKGVP